MEKISFHLKKKVCFRRWSRKAYAIFSSLGVCVTIGHLNTRVADCSLSKQKGKMSVLPDAKEGCFLDDAKEESDTKPVPILLFMEMGHKQQSVSFIENHTTGIDSLTILRI